MGQFFSELKRRHIFKVAAAYLVVGWLVVQAAAITLPAFEAPAWVLRVFILIVLLGFPIALVLAWIFDLTPEGVRVTTGSLGNRRFYLLVGVLTLLALAWFFMGQPAYRTGEEPYAEAQPSIAVLPFVNMSPDPENEYFADGISEELINVLAGVEGLQVASRTSAFSFKGRGASIREIAAKLGVGHVLEGSVRRQRDRVRITAQLIESASDVHLWSGSYDRKLTDIFQVQEEIAQAITAALEPHLGTRRVSVEAPTRDLEAYDLFLRGRLRFHRRGWQSVEIDGAVADLKEAVRRDPEFADAWAYLGAAAHVLATGTYPTELERDEIGDLAKHATDQALALHPDHPIALAVRGMQHASERRFDEALTLLERAARLETRESTVRLWLGIQYLYAGLVEQALPPLEAAYRQDPLVAINNVYLGNAYLMAGREGDGEHHVRRAMELRWRVPWSLMVEIANRNEVERMSELLRWIEPPVASLEADFTGAYEAALRDPSRRQGLIERLRQPADLDSLSRLVFAALSFGDGDTLFDEARSAQSLEGVVAETVLNWVFLTAWLPSLDWLREDPRFLALARDSGLAAVWEQRGMPLNCHIIDGPRGEHLACP